MPALFAFLAFGLAFIFHGTGFSPGPWFDWQALALLGLVLLTFDLSWPHMEALRARRTTVVTQRTQP